MKKRYRNSKRPTVKELEKGADKFIVVLAFALLFVLFFAATVL